MRLRDVEVRDSSCQVDHGPGVEWLEEQCQLPQVVEVLEEGSVREREQGVLPHTPLIGGQDSE